MSRRALFDVNVLIALFDAGHVHHEIAHDWFADNGAAGWATCPLTENRFLRVLNNPRAEVEDRTTILASLKAFCRSDHHEFWADTISLRDDTLFNPSVTLSHRQITDVYLLGLATRRKGCLVTFDGKIPLKAVKGATTRHLSIISPG